MDESGAVNYQLRLYLQSTSTGVRSSPVPPQVRRDVKRDGAERGLPLASVLLLTCCGVNRLLGYVFDMVAIIRPLSFCKEENCSQTMLEGGEHLTSC